MTKDEWYRQLFERLGNSKFRSSFHLSKRQIMRQSLNSTPPVMGGAASGIRPEDYLTMA